MESPHQLIARDEPISSDYSFIPSVSNLVLALLTLIVFALVLACILYALRKRQSSRDELLPTHQKTSNHRRLTITATPYTGKSESIHVYDEKRNLIENSSTPPDSPVPEIRITFPDEEDQCGKTKNGRVVVVRIGDSGSVGMEPVAQDPLPPYQTNEADRFHSLDLERIGGLKENTAPRRWS